MWRLLGDERLELEMLRRSTVHAAARIANLHKEADLLTAHQTAFDWSRGGSCCLRCMDVLTLLAGLIHRALDAAAM